jgi:hypothetical protein
MAVAMVKINIIMAHGLPILLAFSNSFDLRAGFLFNHFFETLIPCENTAYTSHLESRRLCQTMIR